MQLAIGVLEGRLTPSKGRGIQFFPDDNWEKEFVDAQTAGFSAIELLVRPKGLREHPLMTRPGQTRIKELSKANDIAVPSVHGYYSPEDAYATDLVDIVKAASSIGSKVILLSFFHEKKLSPKKDATWERAHTLIAPAAKIAKEKGIQFGIEAELPASALLEFVGEAGTPEVLSVYYDLGNQFACGFPVVEEIKELGHKIVGVHVKDRLPNTDPGVESASVPLGEGCANFKEAFQALKEIGYARPLILQAARGVDGDEIERNKKYREFTQHILQEIWRT